MSDTETTILIEEFIDEYELDDYMEMVSAKMEEEEQGRSLPAASLDTLELPRACRSSCGNQLGERGAWALACARVLARRGAVRGLRSVCARGCPAMVRVHRRAARRWRGLHMFGVGCTFQVFLGCPASAAAPAHGPRASRPLVSLAPAACFRGTAWCAAAGAGNALCTAIYLHFCGVLCFIS